MIGEQDDRVLISNCLADDDGSAWEVFVRRYSGLIWKTIHRSFRVYNFRYEQEDLEDVFSSVFLSLLENDFRKLREFRGDAGCSLSTWLSVVASRLTTDYMRKDRSRYHAEPVREGSDMLESVAHPTAAADRVLEDFQEGEQLRKAIKSLSEQDRMIFDLLFNKGASAEETARRMNISVDNLYTKKHRMIGRIKKNLQQV